MNPQEWGEKDFYQVLGVRPNASDEDIRRAYRELLKEYHPDVNLNVADLEIFYQIVDAYEVLGDRKNRADYDKFKFTDNRYIRFEPGTKTRERHLFLRVLIFLVIILLLRNMGYLGANVSKVSVNTPSSSFTKYFPSSNNNQILALMVGPEGPPGPAGVAGKNGFIGMNGYQGKDGIPGAPGAVGPAGPTGAAGAAGPQGVAGINGAPGVAGATGPAGAQGASGAAGAPGAPGAAGPSGAPGAAGTNGTNGVNGSSVIAIKIDAGTECKYGGTRFEDGNGIQVGLACNGAGYKFGQGIGTISTCTEAADIAMSSKLITRPSIYFTLQNIHITNLDPQCAGSTFTLHVIIQSNLVQPPPGPDQRKYQADDVLDCDSLQVPVFGTLDFGASYHCTVARDPSIDLILGDIYSADLGDSSLNSGIAFEVK